MSMLPIQKYAPHCLVEHIVQNNFTDLIVFKEEDQGRTKVVEVFAVPEIVLAGVLATVVTRFQFWVGRRNLVTGAAQLDAPRG